MVNFALYVEVAYQRLIVLSLVGIYYFYFRKKVRSLERGELALFTSSSFWLCFILFVRSGYYFDWRNKIRLLHKFDMLALYRMLMFIVINSFNSMFSFAKTNRTQEGFFFKLKELHLQFGVILCTVSLNFKYEYRMSSGKLLEFMLVVHLFVIGTSLFGCYGKEHGKKEEKPVSSK